MILPSEYKKMILLDNYLEPKRKRSKYKQNKKPGVVTYAYNPSYLGGRDQKN
jgi:hypothetical protein